LERDRVSDDTVYSASHRSLSYRGNRFFAHAQNDRRVAVAIVASSSPDYSRTVVRAVGRGFSCHMDWLPTVILGHETPLQPLMGVSCGAHSLY